MGDPKSWAEFGQTVGWPVAALMFLIFVAWKGWQFVKPYAVKFMDAQLSLIETVKSSSEKSAAATERMSDSMEMLNSRHDKHDAQLHEIRMVLEKKG